MRKATILVAAEERDAAWLSERLAEWGCTVSATASTPRRVAQAVAGTVPDLALVDLGLDGGSGVDAAEVLAGSDVPVVYLACPADAGLLRRARRTGPYGYVSKPFDAGQLRSNVATALAMRESERRIPETAAGEGTNGEPQTDTGPAKHRWMRMVTDAFDAIGDAVAVVDANRVPLIYNQSMLALIGPPIVGATADEITANHGIFLADRVTPFTGPNFPLTSALRGESSDAIPMFVRNQHHPDGVDLSVSAKPLRDAAGMVVGCVIIGRDVTALAKAQAGLRHSNEALRQQLRLMETIFETMSDGVIVADEHEDYVIRNASAQRLVGEFVPGTTFEGVPEAYGLFRPDQTTLFPADDVPLTRAVRLGESTDGIEMFVRSKAVPDGRHVSVSGRPLRDGAGAPKGGLVVIGDITEQKNREIYLREVIAKLEKSENSQKRIAEEYRAQSQALELVFDNMVDAVLLTDAQGMVVRLNPAAERIVGTGILKNERQRWDIQFGVFQVDRETAVPPEELPQSRALRGEQVRGLELFVRNAKVPDGVYVNVNASPLFDAEGELHGTVVVFRDVTARQMAQEALSEAFAEGRLEILDTLLHNVGNAVNSVAAGVGTIGERLRTSRLERRLAALASALKAHESDWATYLDTDPQGRKAIPFLVALAREFPERTTELLQVVDRVDERVQHIVDIVRTQRSFNPRRPARKQVELRRGIDAAVRMLQESIAERGIEVQVDCSRAPVHIWIEESRFQQVLVNLVKNAVEAIDELAESSAADETRPRPRIRIHAFTENDFLVLDVIDNGIGIAEDRLRAIFRVGYSTKPNGTGVGLHSSANFAIASGGTLRPQSDGIGKGTTMRLQLRLAWLMRKSRGGDATEQASGTGA